MVTPTTFGELRAAIAGTADGIEITRIALCVAHTYRDAFEGFAHSAPGTRLSAAVLQPAGALLGGVGVDLTPSVRTGLLAIIGKTKTATDVARQAVVAQAIAEALEASLESRFVTHLAASGRRELSPGDLIPYISPFGLMRAKGEAPFAQAFAGTLSTNPARLASRRPGQLTRRARLVTELPPRVRLVWDPDWTELDALMPASKAAAVVPGTFADLKTTFDDENARFFPVTPKNPAASVSAALAHLASAEASGSAIAVLPELCVDEAGAVAIADWVETNAKHLSLVVCGSFHRELSGVRENVAIVTGAGRAREGRIEQPKLRPFVFPLDGRDFTEDITEVERVVTIFSGRWWSALALVCIDFINDDVKRFAEDLRPALVLVPACTAKSDVFHATALSHAARGQAHTIFANLNATGGAETAIISRPTRVPSAVIRTVSADFASVHVTPLGELADWT